VKRTRTILRAFSVVICALLLLVTGCGGGKVFTPGEYAASSKAVHGDVTVTITVNEKKITKVAIAESGEENSFAAKAYATMTEQVMKAQSAEIDGVTGATISTNAVKTAAAAALAEAKGEEMETGVIGFTPGTYNGKAGGFQGPVELAVSFTDDSISKIEIVKSGETEHVGTVAYGPMFKEIMDYTSTGVDVVSGATFTSKAILGAVEDAAMQAGCQTAALRKGAKPYVLTPGAKITGAYDVVIVGAGGAGITAGAQAAQNGATVCIIEKEAEAGGNTIVSGCSFQNVMECLVWEMDNPDATTGYYAPTGETYEKGKNEMGRIDTLKMILGWSEKPFDGKVGPEVKNVSDYNLPGRGVHAEYLPTLKTLKKQIRAYLDWADKKMTAGADETDLTLFSTVELYIFQTYYGGLRLNNEKTEWIYGDFDLVSQVCTEIQDTKEWFIEQGSLFLNSQSYMTLIGCLWPRINRFDGGMVDGQKVEGRWGTYFAVPLNTIAKANPKNTVMYRTTAKSLVTDGNGRVTGVKAVKYDGTEVEITANKAVILATGGYAYNSKMVMETNDYWNKDDVTAAIKTTNRSLAKGEGLTMATAVGAATTGMGFTQLMPIGWMNTGNLAGGRGEDVIFISPAGTPNAGKRYVDESAERDVLAQGAYDFGGDNGAFIQIANGNGRTSADNQADREYFCTLSEASGMLGIDTAVLRRTITDYDKAYRNESLASLEVPKSAATALIGNYNSDGSFDEGGILSVRYLAPSTHHTMGGLVVDTERHVLDKNGHIIEGLLAAGEVTGGIFAGNRLGGNAISEIIVSGRIAAQTATK